MVRKSFACHLYISKLSSFIPQLFASSLLPHITQKFSVDQLIQIGLPLAWANSHTSLSYLFSSSSPSAVLIKHNPTYRKQLIPKEKMAEIAKAVLNKLTIEEIKVSKTYRIYTVDSVTMITVCQWAETITVLCDDEDGYCLIKTASIDTVW